MASTSPEPQNAQIFKHWLASHGGYFHPNVRYTSGRSTVNGSPRITALIIPLRVVSSGLSIVASEAIDSDAIIVTCPFSIFITPRLSKDALLPLLRDTSLLERWTERQLIIVYICFHWIASTDM